MASKKSTIIAAAVIIALIILLIILRVTLELSEVFYLILGAVVAANLAILTWIFVQHRKEKMFARRLVSEGRELRVEYSFLRKVAGVPIKFRYKELEKATDNFQALIGKGSSAYVFKGILDDGTPVAVKRIEGVEHGEREFKAEVSAIASAQHVNLVRLFGYCSIPGGPRILVYEFAHNGSLDTWIFPQREIIGGRRNVRLVRNGDNRQSRWSYFPKIVAECMREGKLMEVVDGRLLGEGGEVDERQVRILVHVALWCIQENPNLRPNMVSVVDMLEERVSMDAPPPTEMIVLDVLGVDHEETNGVKNGVAMQPTNQMENQLSTVSACSYSMSILSGR
ncbi:hypothetical protein IFM89_009464 [Coptis chinensis]|uniref:Protein kinase domain-containing protein n=1 Tax=Coptis chinensis TaxID=261450 RepID=A0A835IBS3_9MAGN|nr:hypothetical protein IFM89_009464 [Coptis chinensis]